jgi:hypothetical protein
MNGTVALAISAGAAILFVIIAYAVHRRTLR